VTCCEAPYDPRSYGPADYPDGNGSPGSEVVTLAREKIDVVADEEGERESEDETNHPAELCHLSSVRLSDEAFK
jgi:hypothetical protein